MSQFDTVLNHLFSLETPDSIAEFLESKGARGEMQDGESCVITNYILGETDAIGCSTTEAEIIVEDDYYNAHSFGTTPAVSEFIHLFDQGYYPQLVDESCDTCSYNGCACCDHDDDCVEI